MCLLVPGAVADKCMQALWQGDGGPDLATPAAAIRQLLCAPGTMHAVRPTGGTHCEVGAQQGVATEPCMPHALNKA